jgi:hypothetical protein
MILNHSERLKRNMNQMSNLETSPVPPKRPNLGSDVIRPPSPPPPPSSSSTPPVRKTEFWLTDDDAIKMGFKPSPRIAYKELYLHLLTHAQPVAARISYLNELVDRAQCFTPVPNELASARTRANALYRVAKTESSRLYGASLLQMYSNTQSLLSKVAFISQEDVRSFSTMARKLLHILDEGSLDVSDLIQAANDYLKELVPYFASFGWTIVPVSSD